MKCLKCSAEMPHSATKSLCSSCKNKQKPKPSTTIKVTTFILGTFGLAYAMHGCFSAPSAASVSNSVASASDTWSGSGPDCTPNGHPDPNHPGVIISDRYTDACPDQEPPLKDAHNLDEKYGIYAMDNCARDADDYLRTVTRYDFKWDEIGLLDAKFDSFRSFVKQPGVLTLVSTKASVQNGFGAFRHITLLCDYDTQGKRVVGYHIQGR